MAKADPGSNYIFEEIFNDASLAATTHYSSAIDHSSGESATVLITTLVAATTLVATVQNSNDNGVLDAWTDQTADGSKNDISVDIGTDVETNQLNIPNPIKRYSRIKFVITGTACEIAATSCKGPRLMVMPTVATLDS